MVVASFFVAALLQATPLTSAARDTLSASTQLGATSAPTDSAGASAWQRRVPSVDARLVPDWNRSLPSDTIPRRRRKAVEYSDEYYSRLQMHRVGSWLEFPIFGAEYWLGQKLISREGTSDWVKPTHAVVAGALGGLFALNTVTGVWNLYESRHDTDDRALVWLHSALMLASDAGFLITAMRAGDAEDSIGGENRHRDAALVSMGIASAGTLIMWFKRGL
jgi:hypothetical protein